MKYIEPEEWVAAFVTFPILLLGVLVLGEWVLDVAPWVLLVGYFVVVWRMEA